MINSKNTVTLQANGKRAPANGKEEVRRYRRLVSMGRRSMRIINKLYNPIDSINRFINLALQSIEEDSQSRQFLLESKQGIRNTALLLKRLNSYAKKIEKEISEMSEDNG
ncbi:MAG: hypothetical protein HZA30_05730 [Candidatus Omnitrophica bacterium]|nr:hypothetical protein [Candidatus Omnitrophota bacterium]